MNSGAFDYRTFTTLSFAKNDWNLGLRWRPLPTIKPSAFVSNPNTTTIDTPSYDAFDLSGGLGTYVRIAPHEEPHVPRAGVPGL